LENFFYVVFSHLLDVRNYHRAAKVPRSLRALAGLVGFRRFLPRGRPGAPAQGAHDREDFGCREGF
jgi:hypothetical protein